MWRTLGIGIALLGAHLVLTGPAAASGGNIRDGRDTMRLAGSRRRKAQQ